MPGCLRQLVAYCLRWRGMYTKTTVLFGQSPLLLSYRMHPITKAPRPSQSIRRCIPHNLPRFPLIFLYLKVQPLPPFTSVILQVSFSSSFDENMHCATVNAIALKLAREDFSNRYLSDWSADGCNIDIAKYGHVHDSRIKERQKSCKEIAIE